MRRPALAPPRRTPWRGRLAAAVAAGSLLTAVTTAVTGCAALRDTVPGCGDPQRLAIIAQSVPSASYLPCLRQLPPGWSASGFDASRGGTSFLLNSDRAPGHPVKVELTAACVIRGASPSRARAAGVLTYTKLSFVSPRVAGSIYDVFPGGCVRYGFDFALGPHIALIQQFEAAVGLHSRQQLRITLKKRFDVELDP